MHRPNHLEDNKNRVGQKKVKQIEGSITKEGLCFLDDFVKVKFVDRLEDFILI